MSNPDRISFVSVDSFPREVNRRYIFLVVLFLHSGKRNERVTSKRSSSGRREFIIASQLLNSLIYMENA